MAPWTRYQLVNGSEEQSNAPKSRRLFLEWPQALQSFSQVSGKRLQPLSSRYKQHPTLWKTSIIAGAALVLLAVLVGLLAGSSQYDGGSADKDILQYVDPLIGTGLGGAYEK